jgi:hypothetical protein
MLRSVLAAAALVAMSGCASIVNETTHPIKIETATADGTLLSGAECKMSNEYGSFNGKSGETTQARRSGKDLDIVCKLADQPDAVGRAISRANAGLAGNIIFGGGIGAIIDHTKGTADTRPGFAWCSARRWCSIVRRRKKGNRWWVRNPSSQLPSRHLHLTNPKKEKRHDA